MSDVIYRATKVALKHIIVFLADYYLDTNNNNEFADAVINFYFNNSYITSEKNVVFE